MEKYTIGKSIFAQGLSDDEFEYIFCPDCGSIAAIMTDGSFYCERCNRYYEIVEIDYSLVNVEVQEIKD